MLLYASILWCLYNYEVFWVRLHGADDSEEAFLAKAKELKTFIYFFLLMLDKKAKLCLLTADRCKPLKTDKA